MKMYGKVTKYDGYIGNIKGIDGNDYVLVNKNIMDGNNLDIYSDVEFDKENFNTVETNENIARYVKVLKK